MSRGSTADAPRVVHALPGRVRAHLPAWTGADAGDLERRVLAVPGVERARASAATRNLLVHFDARATDAEAILAAVRAGASHRARRARPEPPPAVSGPRAARPERPPAAREPTPEPPPAEPALVQSAVRLAGATLGLGFLALRRAMGGAGPPSTAEAPFVAAALLSVAEGVPPLRNLVRGVVGDRPATVVLGSAAVAAQTMAGKSTSLVVGAGAALRALTATRARAAAWDAYAERTRGAPPPRRGTRVRLRAGDRLPTAAVVVRGTGTVVDRDGLPRALAPGARAGAGGRVRGGPLVVELGGPPAHAPPGPRPDPRRTLSERYGEVAGVLAVGASVAAGLLTRSSAAALVALQLLNARTAAHARQSAEHGAAARAVRSGAVLGPRPDPRLRAPDVLLIGAPRLLADGLETVRAAPLTPECSASDVLRITGEVATAAGSPWGRALPGTGADAASDAGFDGRTAAATLHGVAYEVAPETGVQPLAAVEPGVLVLRLARADGPTAMGVVVLRPRLSADAAALVETCRRLGIAPALLDGGGDRDAAATLAGAAGIPLLDADDPVTAVRGLQGRGARVAALDDSVDGAALLAASDLAIAVTPLQGAPFAAGADVLAPDLRVVAAVLDAGARARAAERDGTLAAALANGAGLVWALRGAPTVRNASKYVTLGSGAALLVSFARLAGGPHGRAAIGRLADPQPERWGRRPVADVMAALGASDEGLSSHEAARRRVRRAAATRRSALADAFSGQLRSPATAVLGAGAALALSIGATADVAMIAAVVAANTLIEAWQQSRTRESAEALEHLTAAEARVLRDGAAVTIPADEVVVGDVLLLASGDHVPADARVTAAQGLLVDEAALTGESMPVGKSPANGDESNRILLHGSDVTVGTGRAVAVAVGAGTRLGSIAAALETHDDRPSPLAVRLEQMMRQGLPIVGAAGAVVAAAGVLRGRSLASQVPLGASIAIAAVPEGLQLLASVAAAGVARRLARHHALVRTLPAVDALGRVDVACADKTGTLTIGRLSVRAVADLDAEARPAARMAAPLEAVLRVAAVASPHPDASDAGAHPTDVAVARAAESAGLVAAARARRALESSFDPERGFHAAVANGRLCVKGAVEVLAPRCTAVRRQGRDVPLGDGGEQELLDRAAALAARGLRVLMVAEGPGDAAPDDPRDLVALGFLGIADPLRPGVRGAIRRCEEAGVRVLMLTGDHPETAVAIAREAGLANGAERVLTGAQIAELGPEALDRRLEDASVIARITPVDKLRIVESLQRRGHTVAMTGDGVNDAPALRLADVGVAMGRHGTEVARQAADVILTEDDFHVLTEALLEGRGFWRNMRRALGLLLGGNLGEVGLVLGAAVLGLPSPLTARQILAVNLVTDVLPAVAVAMQPPGQRDLRALAREGAEALDGPLRRDIVQRAVVTAVPSLAAYAAAGPAIGRQAAGGVGFGAICATQLALTVVDGRRDRNLSFAVTGAVLATGAIIVGALTLPPARAFLGFTPLGPAGWALIAAAAAGTAVLARGTDAGPEPASAPDRGGAGGSGAR